jgi:hypothetical protein
MVVEEGGKSTNVDIDAGYHSFSDIKTKLEKSGVIVKYFVETARIWLETTNHKVTIHKKLLELLGLRRFKNQLVLRKGSSVGGDSRIEFKALTLAIGGSQAMC